MTKKMRVLCVNSLGEVFGRACSIIVSSVNVMELKSRIGHEPSSKDITHEFNRLLREATSAENYKFVQLVWSLQKHNDSRFRFWARGTGKFRGIWLSTEFRSSVENKTLWSAIRKRARETGSQVWLMNRCKEDGVLMKQVDYATLLTPKETPRHLIRRIKKATEEFWIKDGVNVL